MPQSAVDFSVLHYASPLTFQVILASQGENLLEQKLECMSNHAGHTGNSIVSAEGRQGVG